ncbi:signal peptidase I [Phocaeicola sp.]
MESVTYSILYTCCGGILLWLLLQVLVFASFKIPTNSMEPTLYPGDYIVVNKLVQGARLFDVWDAIDGKRVKIHRLPGFGKISRNDILVFNFPYHYTWDSIALDVTCYYVKRCIALPGDSVFIRNAHYHVKGCKEELGNRKMQDRMAVFLNNGRDMTGISYYVNTTDTILKWTIKDYGPLYVPGIGDEIVINGTSILLYGKLIEWERGERISKRNGLYYLGNARLKKYKFARNYYFVAGDNGFNSQDSRYWGVLPEEFIVGKAALIWKSVDLGTDEIRWGRVFKKI